MNWDMQSGLDTLGWILAVIGGCVAFPTMIVAATGEVYIKLATSLVISGFLMMLVGSFLAGAL